MSIKTLEQISLIICHILLIMQEYSSTSVHYRIGLPLRFCPMASWLVSLYILVQMTPFTHRWKLPSISCSIWIFLLDPISKLNQRNKLIWMMVIQKYIKERIKEEVCCSKGILVILTAYKHLPVMFSATHDYICKVLGWYNAKILAGSLAYIGTGQSNSTPFIKHLINKVLNLLPVYKTELHNQATNCLVIT